MRHKLMFLFFVLIGIIFLLLTALDFMALHDIRNEYVSQDILNYLKVTLSEDIPAWTANKAEWDYLTVSIVVRVFLYLLTFAICLYCYKNMNPLKYGNNYNRK